MDKVLSAGPIGSEANYGVEFKGGNLVVNLAYQGHLGGVKLEGNVPAHAVLEAIKNKIPGKIDDAIINLLESVLLA